jgi:hypothetical protein
MKTIDINAVTGEEILRDMTPAEIDNINKIAETNKAKVQAETIKDSAKSALLAKLGITADEAALLLG